MWRFRLSPDGESGTTGDTGAEPKTVPLEALVAERKARQDLAERLTKIEAERKAAEEKAAGEAGEYKSLFEKLKPEHEKLAGELDTYRKRETERAERLGARNAERIGKLSEAGQKAVKPLVGVMAPDALADWLDENAETFGGTGTRPAGTQSRDTKGKEDPIPPECSAEWRKHGQALGVSERDWYENTWKPRHKAKA